MWRFQNFINFLLAQSRDCVVHTHYFQNMYALVDRLVYEIEKKLSLNARFIKMQWYT